MIQNRKIRIYIDNSFAGKLYNPLFPEIEKEAKTIRDELIKKSNNNEIEIFKSSTFDFEHNNAPKEVKQKIEKELNKLTLNTLQHTENIDILLEEYSKKEILRKKNMIKIENT